MKKRAVIFLSLLSLIVISCKDDSSMAGTAVLESTDVIKVREDTFPISTMIDTCDYIISSPDSFLLGEREETYGTIKADILTQLACPEGYVYPKGTVFDSIRIFLYYKTWTGDNLSPLSINVYEMDRATLDYSPNPKYKTNEPLEKYCSLADSTIILQRQRIVVPELYQDSAYYSSLAAYLPAVSFTVDPNSGFFKRFTSKLAYTTQGDFNEHILKGLYITTDFGSSAVLNISSIMMVVSYHFTYTRFDGVEVTEMGEKSFYSNSEVKQINRFIYEDRTALLKTLQEDSAYNYIVAPAGIYTYVDLPMRQMYDTILGIVDPLDKEAAQQQYETYSAYVNLARLQVMVDNNLVWEDKGRRRTTYAAPAQQVLLIRCGQNNERLHAFFEDKELPSDTVAVLSSLYTGVDVVGNTTFYYSFDISSLLTNILHVRPDELPNDRDNMRVALVPVSIVTSTNSNGSTSVVAMKEEQTISVTRLYSTKNPAVQTTLQVVSSLFFKDY